MAEKLPALLIVEGLEADYRALAEAIDAYDGGRLTSEFEVIHLDCYEALRAWYARNPGRFVSLVLQGVDFTGIENEGKLVGYPELKYPVPKDFDAREFQGLVIYALMRETGIDQVVPVIFVSRAPETLRSSRFYSFMLYPSHGVCQFIHVSPDPEGMEQVVRRADTGALRPFDDERRAHWRTHHRMVIGRSRKMVYLAHEIERLGPGDSIVMLLGSTGVGKELVANALHRCSRRFIADDPVRCLPSTVNIAALAGDLIEDELFGHVKGSFTSSVGDREGVFEVGNGSTVFLDEIGDIGTEVQLKLLRTFENHRIKRIGSPQEVPVDMRIVTATNRTIDELLLSFRPDFYSRVVQQCLLVPSLIERWQGEPDSVVEADLYEILQFIVDEMNAGPRTPRLLEIDRGAVKFLHQLVAEFLVGGNDIFNGNMRTLRAALEQAWERAQYDGSQSISVGHIISTVGVLRYMNRRSLARERHNTLAQVVGSLNIKAVEKRAIVEALEQCDANQSRAAEILGMHRDTLRRKITEHGI